MDMTGATTRERVLPNDAGTHVDILYNGMIAHLLLTSSYWRVWWPTDADFQTVHEAVNNEASNEATVRPERSLYSERRSVESLLHDDDIEGARILLELDDTGVVVWVDETDTRWVTQRRPQNSVSITGHGSRTQHLQHLLPELRPSGITQQTAEDLSSIIAHRIEHHLR